MPGVKHITDLEKCKEGEIMCKHVECPYKDCKYNAEYKETEKSNIIDDFEDDNILINPEICMRYMDV